MRHLFFLLFVLLLGSQTLFGSIYAYANKGPKKMAIQADVVPNELKEVGIEENFGGQVDLATPFVNEEGREVVLSQFFDGRRPVILSFVYYNCPNLCGLYLDGLVHALRKVDLTVGNEFDVVVISVDPNETPKMAMNKKNHYVTSYNRPESKKGWHFLTGSEKDIKKIANQVGFKYKWDQSIKQWIHASAGMVLTPKGKVSFYHYDIAFDPKTIRLSLIDASAERIGKLIDHALLFCLQYDPSSKGYGVYIFNLMRVFAGGCAALLIGYISLFWYRNRKNNNNIT